MSTGRTVSPRGSHTVPSIHSFAHPLIPHVLFKGQQCANPPGEHWVDWAAAVCPGEAGEVIYKSSRVNVAPGLCRAPGARSGSGTGYRARETLLGRAQPIPCSQAYVLARMYRPVSANPFYLMAHKLITKILLHTKKYGFC